MALRSWTIALALVGAEGVRACATCAGPADAPQSMGMNAAILTLLAVLCTVGMTVAFFVFLVARRMSLHDAIESATEHVAPHAMALPET